MGTVSGAQMVLKASPLSLRKEGYRKSPSAWMRLENAAKKLLQRNNIFSYEIFRVYSLRASLRGLLQRKEQREEAISTVCNVFVYTVFKRTYAAPGTGSIVKNYKSGMVGW